MIEADQILPMIYEGTTSLIKRYLNFYLKDDLKGGYEEMSEINLNYAEMGLEEDVLDLIMYESTLIGRETL